MGWYRGTHERFAYCLTRDLHALVVMTTATETQKRETAGACPAASLTPAPAGRGLVAPQSLAKAAWKSRSRST